MPLKAFGVEVLAGPAAGLATRNGFNGRKLVDSLGPSDRKARGVFGEKACGGVSTLSWTYPYPSKDKTLGKQTVF